ncbi:hypothetical protein DN730_06260 [Marinomonas piezotolerans]|uniref:Uncharacterized protein n=1 Tax=Marinomonas piezotolerans TaxID=2213058 RepID=A0A370UBT6_9GAMM|nr:hypothetical protein [Marinomonas piezotolerans]RDL45209.1 hypothetical protein DN730_06260 [Marinomonas piezotolerans]
MQRALGLTWDYFKSNTGYGVALGCVLYLLALVPYMSGLLVLASVVYWAVFISSWRRLNRRNKRQIIGLLAIGMAALMLAMLNSVAIPVLSLLQGNLPIVAMLTGVSLLGLLPDTTKPKSPILGVKGVISTWYSIQLLSSVINMSALFVVGDKLQRQSSELSLPQYSVMIRALSSTALLSPFFASMAVALSVAPEAEFHQLATIGLPVALLACGVSIWEFKRKQILTSFSGFPLALSSLIFPVFLALLVLVFHYILMPDLAILAIVTLLSPLAVVVVLFITGGPRHTKQRLRDHAQIRLSNMGNEVSLFLAAGFLTTTVSLALKGVLGEGWSLFDQFGFVEAYVCYLAICATAIVGLHPIIGISMMSSMVPAHAADNTLLAFVCLCAWAVGTAVGPLSGINLSVSGKYGVDNILIARFNWFYGAIMSLFVGVAMFVFSWML